MDCGHVNANGQKLYYEIHGEGEPLVMILGLGGDVTAWQMQIPALKKHFKVIVFDNRDVGRSSEATEPYQIADIADDAAALMNALDIEQAHILGASMGGMIAQELVLNHPHKIRKLILLCTLARCPRFLVHRFRLWKWIWERDPDHEVLPIAGMQLGMMSAEFFKDDTAVDEMLEQMRKPLYPQSLVAWSRQVDAAANFDSLDRLSAIKASTLILVGDQDMSTPVWANREIAEAIPEAQLQILEGGNHAVAWEMVDQVNQAIVDFLEE